jgi:hypothetical protein
VHRRDLESLRARFADDLVVHTNEVIAQLGELGAIALVGAGRQTIFFRAPYPSHGVLVRTAAARTTESLVAIFVFVEEEGAFV